MDLPYSIPENAEIISSIGVALSMVRDVVERVIPNPTQDDIRDLKKEATDAAISSKVRSLQLPPAPRRLKPQIF